MQNIIRFLFQPALLLIVFTSFTTPFDVLTNLAQEARLNITFTDNMSPNELDRAYRKVAIYYHPDKNPDKQDWAQGQSRSLNIAREEAKKALERVHARSKTPEPMRNPKQERAELLRKEINALLASLNAKKTEYYEGTQQILLRDVAPIPAGFFTQLARLIPNLKIFELENYPQIPPIIRPLENLDGIDQLQNLKKLLINTKNVENMPISIGNLSHLEELDFIDTKITQLIPEITKLKNLNKLDLSLNNNLKQIPSFIGDCENLETINLFASGVINLPPEITKLKKLTKLNLSHTPIKSIPSIIWDLSGLKTLDLSFLHIVELSKEINKLQQLENLELSYTKIKEIPDEISSLPALKTLNIAGLSPSAYTSPVIATLKARGVRVVER